MKYQIINTEWMSSLQKITKGFVFLNILLSLVILLDENSYAVNKVGTSTTHTLSVTTLNTVTCTGANTYGECDVSSWKDITQVAAGFSFSVALDITGTVYCTGNLFFTNACDVSSLNVDPIVYITAGDFHIVAVDDDGDVFAVGRNFEEQTDVGSWSNIIAVDAGTLHTLGLESDGDVVCTGDNSRYQCDVSSWSGITQISAGGYFSLGLGNGNVEFTGWNNNGQGNVTGWTNITHISAGTEHSVAVDNSGTPYAAGQNNNGQCNVNNWTIIGEVVAGTTSTIGVQVNGELTVIGDTTSVVNDVEGWQLINNPPDLVTASIACYEDYSVTTDNLYSQSTDFEGHSITVVTGNPIISYGTVVNHGDGTYTYSPTTDFNGANSFTYTLTDNQPINPTNTAMVSISVTPVNDVPYYSCAQSLTILEDGGMQSISAWACSLTAGAYNEGAQSLSITWTCSDESLFLTAPALSPVTAHTSGLTDTYAIEADTKDLTLTYTFDEDQYGAITLTVVLSDDGGLDYIDYGAEDTYTRTYVIEAISVNDAPTYTKGANLSIYEDATDQVYTEWATNLYEGAIKESEQTLAFTVTNNYPTMFTTEPAIAVSGTTGTLSYTLTADMWGDVTAVATLWDDGGTANGGEYTVAETFTISITPVNDAPDFTIGPDRTILEGSSETYTAWATDLTVGAIMETDQSLAFSVTTSCSECFITEPIVYTSTGDMCYTLAADPFGMVTAWVTLIDSGGTPNGGDDRTTYSFTISITDVNDQPSFSLQSYSITVLEDTTYTNTTTNGYATTRTTITAFAYDITPANSYETNQSVYFSLTNTNSSMFSIQPDIYTATGDMTYTLASNENGVVTITVTITDNGGTNFGGVDTYTDTFVLNVTPVNDPPTMTTLGDQSVLEDDIPVCVSDWAINISKGATNETAQVLTFDFTSDNPDLFLSGPSIVYTQSGTVGDLCYTLNANEFGAATVTMVVYDDEGTENGGFDRITETFEITVIALNDTPTITTISNQTIVESSSTGPLAFTIGDIDADPLTVTVASSDTTLISNTHITFGDTNANSYTNIDRGAFESIPLSITVTPIPGRVGTATITITVFNGNKYTRAEDGVDYTTTTFDVTVGYIGHDGPGGIGNKDGTSGLKLWLKTDQITGLSHGQSLTSWEDQSGYGNTMSISNTPSYSSGFSNGFPAVEFDGASDFLENAGALDFQDVAGFSVFAVFNATNSTATRTIIARDGNGNRGWGCMLDSSDQMMFSVAHSSSQAVTRLGANAMSDSFTIVSYLYDGLIGRSMQVYNGETDDSNTLEYTIPYLVKTTGPNLRIGNNADSNFFEGSIAELIVYDYPVSTVGRKLVNNYLSSKYDIALSDNDLYTGDTAAAGDYDLDIAGIGLESDSINSIAESAGLILRNFTFLNTVGDYLLVGHNRESNALTVTHLPDNVLSAWERSWMIHKTEAGATGGIIRFTFDRAIADMSDLTLTTNLVMLKRSGTSGDFEILNDNGTINGDQIYFNIDASYVNTGDCVTLGSKINHAIRFDAASDKKLVSESEIDLGSSFTIEFWAKRNQTGTMYLFAHGANLSIYFNTNDNIVFDYAETATTIDSYTDTLWHHYAFVYDSSIEIYIDGELQYSGSMSANTGSAKLYFGNAPGETDYFNGDLEEIRIWSDARNLAEIFSNRSLSLQGDEANFLAYWQLNEGAGTMACDKTASANDLNLTSTGDLPQWVVSSLPIGYSSTAQTETLGTLSFTDTSMSMNYHHHNGETVVVTQITTDANVLPDITPATDILDSQYWIVSRTGNTTFKADFTLTTNEDSGSNAALVKLFWRENGSTGSWKAIAYGTSINDTTDTIVFNGIQTDGQFMLALDNSASIAGSGYALYFDGLDDCGINEAENITIANNAFSIEFWARRASIDAAKKSIIGQSDDANGLCIGFNASNEFEFSFNSNTATTGAYTDTQWHHWAVTFDSSSYTQTIYCDGSWITENTASAVYPNLGTNFYIGCGPNSQDHFKGYLDEIRVWEDVRTLSEIQSNMFIPLNGDETGLIAYWRMDEPWSYTYITDVTSNSNTCAVTGSMSVNNWVESRAFSNRTTNEDESFTITAGYDLEGDTFSVSNGSPNSATTSGTTIISYSPFADVNGSDTFSYTVSSTGYPVTVTIVPVNDAPLIGVILDDIIGVNATSSNSFTTTDLENAYSLTFTPISSNQSIVDDSNITINCSAGDCTATTTPETDISGFVQITITVSDPEGLTASSSFGLTVNESPTIGSIGNYSTTVNTATSPIAFTIADTETAEDELDLTLTTSSSEIVGITNASFTQPASGDCTITLTPTSSGVVTINIIVSDALSFSATTSFSLTVLALPEIETIADYTTTVSTCISIPFKVTDADSAESSLDLTITTSDSGILPLSQTLLTNSNGDCTAELTPTSSSGSVTVEITVTDTDGYYTSTTFTLNVSGIPTIENISDNSYSINTMNIITFDVSDDETANGSLGVTVTSISNTTLISLEQISIKNDGGTCTLTLTTTPYQSGTADITVTVTDDHDYTNNTSFTIEVDDMVNAGKAATFDGTSSASSSQNIVVTDHTVEAWIKPSVSDGGIVSIGSGAKFSQMLLTNGNLGVDIFNAGGAIKSYTATTTTINTGIWYHVAYTYNSSADALTLYVNATEETVSIGENQALTSFSLNTQLYIGADQDESIFFSGDIDEVRVWNVVRSQANINADKNSKVDPMPVSLQAYYPFDQTYGYTIFDKTSNGNDCDMNNVSWENWTDSGADITD